MKSFYSIFFPNLEQFLRPTFLLFPRLTLLFPRQKPRMEMCRPYRCHTHQNSLTALRACTAFHRVLVVIYFVFAIDAQFLTRRSPTSIFFRQIFNFLSVDFCDEVIYEVLIQLFCQTFIFLSERFVAIISFSGVPGFQYTD